MSSTTLAIDFGVKYIGLSLVEHPSESANRVLFAATIIVEPKPLGQIVENRAASRRLRRTRKTHHRRLTRLAQALKEFPCAEQIVGFCQRRGFGYDTEEEESGEDSFRISREEFFSALEVEIVRVLPVELQQRALAVCERHLNRDKQANAELRPARFENRGRSRCNWEGCHHNVPRAGNDVQGRLQQSLFLWLQPVFAASSDPAKLRKSLEHWIGELDSLANRLRRLTASELSEEEAKGERKRLDARIKKVYENLRERVIREAPREVSASFLENWKEHYRADVTDIVRGVAAGRVRFCREHSQAFVDYQMERKTIPIKQEVVARDLISRRQQIVFDRLARLVEARLLPLAGGKIDRIVVERVAFDILSGPIKARQKMSEEEASEIYWHGPQAGFASRTAMLREEFGGRCAYCGMEAAAAIEVEHILHRARFPFDSYFNILPACSGCNARKAGRTALEAQLTVHAEAYNAYCSYLGQRKVLHPFHTIKKGMLKLLCEPAFVERGERTIGLIANNLVNITNTQRSPRPLARYLATRLAKLCGQRPEIIHRAARHTALYRTAAIPDYDKRESKETGDLRNHAVDAIMLACQFPSASALENREWTRTPEDVANWMERVRQAAPLTKNGLPEVRANDLIPHFEDDAGDGYAVISLSAFNWNRKRKAAHKLDPFGMTAKGEPVKRTTAAGILLELSKSAAARDKQIAAIAHANLRARLEKHREEAASQFVLWLQQSVSRGLSRATMSNHPADVARRRLLEKFVAMDLASILSAESGETIPLIIGIRVLSDVSARQVNIVRVLPNNPTGQHYQSEAVIKTLYVGYKKSAQGINRQKPILLCVGQNDAVSKRTGGKWVTLELPPGHPLAGRSLGSAEPISEFGHRWKAAFDDLLQQEGISQHFFLSQGCVVEKEDGSRFLMRNFKTGEPWMTSDAFKNIRRVYRSPLRAMK